LEYKHSDENLSSRTTEANPYDCHVEKLVIPVAGGQKGKKIKEKNKKANPVPHS
jgi:hypothetical protein